VPWTTPRNWTVAAVNTVQMNEMSEQLAVLHKGNGHTSLQTLSPSAAGELNIGSVDQTFKMSEPSTNGLKFIYSTGREPGNTINILFDNASTIYTNAPTPPSGYSPIIVNHEQSYNGYSLYQYQIITFVFTGSFWLCNYVVSA
jgi:hypothetical protein